MSKPEITVSSRRQAETPDRFASSPRAGARPVVSLSIPGVLHQQRSGQRNKQRGGGLPRSRARRIGGVFLQNIADLFQQDLRSRGCRWNGGCGGLPPDQTRGGLAGPKNMTNAIIIKLISALMKRPMLTVGAPAFWAASKLGITKAWLMERLRENADRATQAEAVRDREGNLTGEYVCTPAQWRTGRWNCWERDSDVRQSTRARRPRGVQYALGRGAGGPVRLDGVERAEYPRPVAPGLSLSGGRPLTGSSRPPSVETRPSAIRR